MNKREGWICPRCKTVNAPWRSTCSCKELKVEGSNKKASFKTGYRRTAWFQRSGTLGISQ